MRTVTVTLPLHDYDLVHELLSPVAAGAYTGNTFSGPRDGHRPRHAAEVLDRLEDAERASRIRTK